MRGSRLRSFPDPRRFYVYALSNQVCKLRELPIFTFVNKMDRPSLSPFELLDQIEEEFGMKMAPVLWPIGDGERFKVRLCFFHREDQDCAAFFFLSGSPAFILLYPTRTMRRQANSAKMQKDAASRHVCVHAHSNPSAPLRRV